VNRRTQLSALFRQRTTEAQPERAGTEDAQRRQKGRQVRALMEPCQCQRDLTSAGAGNGEKSRPNSSPLCAYECVRRVPSFRWLLCATSVPSEPLWFSG
jgi:hypothetical protein